MRVSQESSTVAFEGVEIMPRELLFRLGAGLLGLSALVSCSDSSPPVESARPPATSEDRGDPEGPEAVTPDPAGFAVLELFTSEG